MLIHKRKARNPWPSYSDLAIENLHTVHRLGFQARWIPTIARPPEICKARTYQISEKNQTIHGCYFRAEFVALVLWDE